MCLRVAVARVYHVMAYQDRPEELKEVEQKALDDGDIQLLKSYGQGPYTKAIKALAWRTQVKSSFITRSA